MSDLMKQIRIGKRVPTHDGYGVIKSFKHSNGIDFAVVEMDDPKKGTRTTSVEGIKIALLVECKRY
jgi:hypothetical protein